MANSFFVPFNHQPDSITFHTSPVTLGSDEYARLIVLPEKELDDNSVQGNQGITIDGTLVVPQTYWATTDWDGSNAEVDITFEASGIVYVYANLGGGFYRYLRQVNGVSFETITTADGNSSERVMAGDRLDWTGASFSNDYMKMYLIPDAPLPTEIWLPPSTVISSGDGSIVRPFMLERYSTYS